MLEHAPDGTPPLVAAPRHLRRRRMHTEIPDALLVPGAEPIPRKVRPPADAAGQVRYDAQQDKESQQLARDVLNRRKRRVALLAVIFVAITVPAIVLALLLG